MTDLRSVPESELRRELERRQAGGPPKRVPVADFDKAIEMFEKHNAELMTVEVSDRDHSEFQQSVYETLAETIYGPKYFDWLNKIRS